MDKKKVKELMKLIHYNVGSIKGMREIDDEYKEDALNFIKEVREELNKSDWVSVEDGLPEYGKTVLVVCETYPSNIWISKRMDRFESGCTLDNHCFLEKPYFPIITHWKPIEKLEE